MEQDDTIAPLLAGNELESRSWTILQAHFNQITKTIRKLLKCTRQVEQDCQSNQKAESTTLALAMSQRNNKTKSVFAFPHRMRDVEKPRNQRIITEEGEDDLEAWSSATGEWAGNTPPAARDGKAAKRAKLEQNTIDCALLTGERVAQAAVLRTEILQAQVMNSIFTTIPVDEEHAEFLRIQRTLMLDEVRKKLPQHQRAKQRADSAAYLVPNDEDLSLRVSIDVMCSSASVDAGE